MNPNKGESAIERLQSITQDELAGMLYENSDEPYAEEIAEEIFKRKKNGNPVKTTTDLRNVIEEALSFLPKNNELKDIIKKTCQRVFQALRIDVNSEFEVLYDFLEKLPLVLKPNGRVAILTFHSGEDRLVKKSFKEGKRNGIYSDISDVIKRFSGGMQKKRQSEIYKDALGHKK